MSEFASAVRAPARCRRGNGAAPRGGAAIAAAEAWRGKESPPPRSQSPEIRGGVETLVRVSDVSASCVKCASSVWCRRGKVRRGRRPCCSHEKRGPRSLKVGDLRLPSASPSPPRPGLRLLREVLAAISLDVCGTAREPGADPGAAAAGAAAGGHDGLESARLLPHGLQLRRQHAGGDVRRDVPGRDPHHAEPGHPEAGPQAEPHQDRARGLPVLRRAALRGPVFQPPPQHPRGQLRRAEEAAGAAAGQQQAQQRHGAHLPGSEGADGAQPQKELPGGSGGAPVLHAAAAGGAGPGREQNRQDRPSGLRPAAGAAGPVPGRQPAEGRADGRLRAVGQPGGAQGRPQRLPLAQRRRLQRPESTHLSGPQRRGTRQRQRERLPRADRPADPLPRGQQIPRRPDAAVGGPGEARGAQRRPERLLRHRTQRLPGPDAAAEAGGAGGGAAGVRLRGGVRRQPQPGDAGPEQQQAPGGSGARGPGGAAEAAGAGPEGQRLRQPARVPAGRVAHAAEAGPVREPSALRLRSALAQRPAPHQQRLASAVRVAAAREGAPPAAAVPRRARLRAARGQEEHPPGRERGRGPGAGGAARRPRLALPPPPVRRRQGAPLEEEARRQGARVPQDLLRGRVRGPRAPAAAEAHPRDGAVARAVRLATASTGESRRRRGGVLPARPRDRPPAPPPGGPRRGEATAAPPALPQGRLSPSGRPLRRRPGAAPRPLLPQGATVETRVARTPSRPLAVSAILSRSVSFTITNGASL